MVVGFHWLVPGSAPGDADLTLAGGAATTRPGKGPKTRTLLQFRVGRLSGAPDPLNFHQTLSALVNGLPAAYAASQFPRCPPMAYHVMPRL
jgi:hypothetical protein